ncbi:hypothetical protein [Nocardia sp. NPDC006630]|uniref:hypothetical protein n=1 Tax=Nocardia sp. NPDC006630 TaxID=3157181 RepID=UPI0033B77A91
MSSTMEESSPNAHWIPFFRFKSDIWLGLVGDMLYVGTLDGPLKSIEPDNSVALLPLLEFGYSEVVSAVSAREDELGWPKNSIMSNIRPILLLQAAISMESVYWTELALKWVDPLSVTEQERAILIDLQQCDWATQAIKHKVKAYLRQ